MRTGTPRILKIHLLSPPFSAFPSDETYDTALTRKLVFTPYVQHLDGVRKTTVSPAIPGRSKPRISGAILTLMPPVAFA